MKKNFFFVVYRSVCKIVFIHDLLLFKQKTKVSSSKILIYAGDFCFNPSLSLLVQLQIAFAPLIGLNSIQYAKGEDWEGRRKCLYPVFKGETLESYFPHFVNIAQVKLQFFNSKHFFMKLFFTAAVRY